MQKIRKRADPDFISILALLAFGLVAYSNSFTAPFQYDDFLHILRNESIANLSDLSRIFHYCEGRFLTYLTLAINYRISTFDPISYHTFNFFIHYFAAIFLYFLFLEVWKTPAMQGIELKISKRAGAFLVAGIFFLHPLQTESVTYVIQRAESMTGMFYLATLLFYLKARRAETRDARLGHSILAGLAALCAAFSKETAVTLPVMIVVFEVFFFNTSIQDLWRKKLFLFILTPAAIILAVQLKGLIQTDFFLDPGPGGMAFTRKQYLLTQFSVLLTYLRLFFWPAGQNIDWDYPLATNFFALKTVSSFLFLLSLLVLSFFAYRKVRLLSLGIIAFFITLAPTSSIIPLRDVIFEHRMYLAVAFLAMGCVHGCSCGLEEIRKISPRHHAIGIISLIIVLLPLLSGLTYNRNEVWLSELSLWADAVKKSPNKARAHNNYGRGLFALMNRVNEKAKREFETAMRLSPGWTKPYHNTALYYFQEGEYDQAIALDLEAIKRKPDYQEALYQLGRSYSKLNQWDGARIYLERLTGMSPGPRYVGAYLDLLEVYLKLDLEDKALDVAGKMRQLPDGVVPLDYHRGLAFYKLNQMETAKSYFLKQTEQESKLLSTYLMLGEIYYHEGDYERAETAFEKAIDESEWSVNANYNLAIILEQRGRFLEASEHLEKVLAVDPFSLDTSVRLVSIYNRLGNLSKRNERLKKLLGLKPTSMEYVYLRANQGRDLPQVLQDYEEKFISGDPSHLKPMAVLATLRGNYQTAIAQYQRYLKTITEKSEERIITNEIHRLEGILQGEEPWRSSV
jgi:tetratricopeptide (TPR) repeat protein